jgi:UDP-GlcNAc:undecaprenyl-phosphate GlcNAc-1-phosphate transferase
MAQTAVPLVLLFISSLASAFVVTGIVKRTSEHIGFVDVPDERKQHRDATPRLGGLAIIFGFGFPLLMLAANGQGRAVITANLSYLFGLIAASSLIVGLGVYDDVLGADAPKKFLIQTGAAVVLVLFGFRFDDVSIAGQVFHLGALGVVASIVWIVGVINAMNFIDGMDSLATVVALTTAVAFMGIAILRDDPISLVVMTALAGSLGGFYPWNKPPAKIFMGDTGSMFIGMLLAAASIAQPTKSPTAIIIGGPIVALALPVIDTLIVMKQRFGGEAESLAARITRVFTADRRHIHHILISRHGSAGRASFSIWLVTVLFAVAAALTVIRETKWFGYGAGGAAFLLLLVLRYRRTNVARASARQPGGAG